jgi:hypothetical protein
MLSTTRLGECVDATGDLDASGRVRAIPPPSEVFKEHVVVSFVGGQPCTDVTPLRARYGLRDGFFTTMQQVLLGTRCGLQDIDDAPVLRFLSDHDVTIFGGGAYHSTITRR